MGEAATQLEEYKASILTTLVTLPRSRVLVSISCEKNNDHKIPIGLEVCYRNTFRIVRMFAAVGEGGMRLV